MSHFTKQEIEEIRERLSMSAVRDSEFPATKSISIEDFVAIVQTGVNKRITIGDFYSEIAPYIDGSYVIRVTPIVKNGSNILHGGGKATLFASVTIGYEDVTERIAPSSFSWFRSSASESGDRNWNVQHSGVGPEIEITSDDVNGSCTFYVEVPISAIR